MINDGMNNICMEGVRLCYVTTVGVVESCVTERYRGGGRSWKREIWLYVTGEWPKVVRKNLTGRTSGYWIGCVLATNGPRVRNEIQHR